MQPNILHLYLMIKVLTFFRNIISKLFDIWETCALPTYHKIPWLPKNNIKLNSLMLKLILIIVHKNRLLTIITAALYPPHPS